METLKTALTRIYEHFSRRINMYVSAIVIFCYHFLFDERILHRCQGDPTCCWMYMVLPVPLITVLLLWMNRRFMRCWRFACRHHRYGWVIFSDLLKALMVAMLWPVAALLDTDWYTSCDCVIFNKKNCSQTLTEKELNEVKGKSVVSVSVG